MQERNPRSKLQRVQGSYPLIGTRSRGTIDARPVASPSDARSYGASALCAGFYAR